jgi:hypothetical protein
MTIDNSDGDDPSKARGDTDEPTRDARGRWRPGYCPNPKGRPKKKPKVIVDQSDIRFFGSKLVEVMSNGEKEMMDRRSALLNKMYESAMKGRVSMQRFLHQEFEKNDRLLAETCLRYDKLLFDYVINNPKFCKPDYDLPPEIEAELQSLRTVLNHYFPYDYPRNGRSKDSDGDPDDE